MVGVVVDGEVGSLVMCLGNLDLVSFFFCFLDSCWYLVYCLCFFFVFSFLVWV